MPFTRYEFSVNPRDIEAFYMYHPATGRRAILYTWVGAVGEKFRHVLNFQSLLFVLPIHILNQVLFI